MSVGGVDIRSLGSVMTRSPGGARNLNYPEQCVFQLIHAVVPICGFGTFNASSTLDALVYDDVWPDVYTVLTETITIPPVWFGEPWVTATRITTYSQYSDIGVTQVVTTVPPKYDWSHAPVASVTSLSVGTTSITEVFVDNGGNTCTYTANLSSQLGSSMWAAWTATAMGMLTDYLANDPGLDVSDIGIAAPGVHSPYCLGTWLSKISSGKGWIDYVRHTGLSSANFTELVCGATYGLPFRCGVYSSGVDGWAPEMRPVAASIADNPQNWNDPISGNASIANSGGIVCSMSRWLLTGLPPYYQNFSGNMTPYNHLTWYAQSATGFTTMSGSVSTVFGPVDPMRTAMFFPADVQAALGGTSTSYGIIGFRPTPV